MKRGQGHVYRIFSGPFPLLSRQLTTLVHSSQLENKLGVPRLLVIRPFTKHDHSHRCQDPGVEALIAHSQVCDEMKQKAALGSNGENSRQHRSDVGMISDQDPVSLCDALKRSLPQVTFHPKLSL